MMLALCSGPAASQEMTEETTQLVRERAIALFHRGVDECRIELMTNRERLSNVLLATRAPIPAMCECASLYAANRTPMDEIVSIGVRPQPTQDFKDRVVAALSMCVKAQPD